MIELHDVTIRRGAFALTGLTHTLPSGGVSLLVGPVGAGKTSILETICGLQMPEEGTLHLRGVNETESQMAARNIGYLPQDIALFDHLNVEENIAFACRQRRWKSGEISARVEELTAKLNLSHLRDRFPTQLSGGQKKVVGIARAVAAKQDIVCLDEPFVALDEDARQRVAKWIVNQIDSNRMMLVVTHHPKLLMGKAIHQWEL